MKKEKFLKTTCIVALALSFCVTGCKNTVSMEEPVIVEKSNSEITKAYISRLKYINNFSSARNCEETVYPSLFYELDIEDKNGNKIFFENFSSEEKEKFSEFWYDELYKDVLYKIEQDESLGEIIDMENSAFEDTINTSAGERAASKVGEITADCLVDNSVKTLKANYKKGNFLVCTDSSSSSSGSYVGHASMMYRDNWDNDWKTNKFYCSQLVWRSWYEVSSKCDLSQGPLVPFVAPSDLSNSRSAKFKTSYKNK